jgi:kinesin family member C2/C3
LSFQIVCLKDALAKKGESENILSTQSSPSVNRIRKGNATPTLSKNRQPMEEVGNLAVTLFHYIRCMIYW